MSTPEERTWDLLTGQLDRIEAKLDQKVSKYEFNKAEKELNDRVDRIEADLVELKEAAISPDQVTNLISSKLKEADAQGISSRERFVRYAVALASIATFTILLYERISNG